MGGVGDVGLTNFGVDQKIWRGWRGSKFWRGWHGSIKDWRGLKKETAWVWRGSKFWRWWHGSEEVFY